MKILKDINSTIRYMLAIPFLIIAVSSAMVVKFLKTEDMTGIDMDVGISFKDKE